LDIVFKMLEKSKLRWNTIVTNYCVVCIFEIRF
jgi:hypothetical protein